MALSPAAIGIVFNKDKNEALLVKRADIPIWVLPGGGIDPNESPEEAVVREIKEETGYEVKIERKCAEYAPINRLSAFTHVFVCQIQGGVPTLSSETTDIRFFTIDSLPPFFFDIHKDWLNDALTSSNLIKKQLTSLTYWSAFKYLIRHPYFTIHYLLKRLTHR